jgi:protein-S-isoprenylcysteine O-methyltransferase Ste14
MDLSNGPRWLPLAGLALLGALNAWRIWLQRRRYGSDSVVLFRGDWRSQVTDASAMAMMMALTLQAGMAVAQPERLRFAFAPALLPGATVLFTGVALVSAAQLNMARSWRIGIDEDARPGLVTHGFYRWIRNPIYSFAMLAFAGYALLLPTWLTLALFVVTAGGVRQQVLREEAYLARTYGDEFRDYARRVGRFVPWIGRGV